MDYQTMRGIEKTKAGNYSVRLCLNYKRYYLGTYKSQEEALNVYKKFYTDNAPNIIVTNSNKPIINLIGQKYNNLTVIEFIGNIENKTGVFWKCLCDCGKIINIRSNAFKRNNTKSCGCIKMAAILKKICKPLGEASFNKVLNYYKQNAKRRNLDFNLSEHEFKDIITMNCHYCQSEPKDYFKKKEVNGNFIYNGIDRKNSTIGYHLENCLPCCRICNRAKSDLTYDQFIVWIGKLKNI